MSGKRNHFFGKKHSEETKKIIREKRKLQKPYMLGKKHTKEAKEKNRLAHIGKNAGNKNYNWKGGLPKCVFCDKRLSGYDAKKCKECLIKNKNKFNCLDCGGNILSSCKRCRKCWMKFNKGENSLRWKGGLTPLLKKIRNCFKYRQWRSDIFTRDDYICQMCGVRGGELNVDHYPKSFSKIFHENEIKSLEQALDCEEFWNINNGRVLCVMCHNKTK